MGHEREVSVCGSVEGLHLSPLRQPLTKTKQRSSADNMNSQRADADGFYVGDDYGYFHWNEEHGHWERWTLNNNEYNYEYAYKYDQDQPGQGAKWEIEAGSSQIVDAPAHLPLPTSSDLPQQSPQEQPGFLAASPWPLANVGTLEEMIEIAWQKCQEYQSKFFMWYCGTLLCTQSRGTVKPVMFELPISSPVEPIVVERPISPVVAESLQRFEKNKQLKVKPRAQSLPISPPVKPHRG
ncbi:hypothetical protein J4Q44_G00045970 [Coregonus suidteri]|uniref:Uncharacterized protein n=1 Tax=Coregonus suidteri TaxID=861788 RepID=A0AAN8MJL1_9TELE